MQVRSHSLVTQRCSGSHFNKGGYTCNQLYNDPASTSILHIFIQLTRYEIRCTFRNMSSHFLDFTLNSVARRCGMRSVFHTQLSRMPVWNEIGLPQQLAKRTSPTIRIYLINVSLAPVDSARNLWNKSHIISTHLCHLWITSSYYSWPQTHLWYNWSDNCMYNCYTYLNHSNIDYCNFILHSLFATQTNRLQLVHRLTVATAARSLKLSNVDLG